MVQRNDTKKNKHECHREYIEAQINGDFGDVLKNKRIKYVIAKYAYKEGITALRQLKNDINRALNNPEQTSPDKSIDNRAKRLYNLLSSEKEKLGSLPHDVLRMLQTHAGTVLEQMDGSEAQAPTVTEVKAGPQPEVKKVTEVKAGPQPEVKKVTEVKAGPQPEVKKVTEVKAGPQPEVKKVTEVKAGPQPEVENISIENKKRAILGKLIAQKKADLAAADTHIKEYQQAITAANMDIAEYRKNVDTEAENIKRYNSAIIAENADIAKYQTKLNEAKAMEVKHAETPKSDTMEIIEKRLKEAIGREEAAQTQLKEAEKRKEAAQTQLKEAEKRKEAAQLD